MKNVIEFLDTVLEMMLFAPAVLTVAFPAYVAGYMFCVSKSFFESGYKRAKL